MTTTISPPTWPASSRPMGVDSGWTPNDMTKPTEFAMTENAPAERWLTYRHYPVKHGLNEPKPTPPFSPEIIKNFTGYNYVDTMRVDKSNEDHYSVGDLMVECDVDVTAASGEFAVELSKGPDRFQARFDLTHASCRLIRNGKVSSKELAKGTNKVARPGQALCPLR